MQARGTWGSAWLHAEKTKKMLRGMGIGLATLIALLGGWGMALIAGGVRDGVAPHLLPQTLPLLLSGVLYIDRFAGVFGVILAASLLLIFLQSGRKALSRGIVAGVLVLGILSAATPLTLVAWLLLVTGICLPEIAQKARLGFAGAMGAIMLSVLMLSGGAFLADMTLVASIASQLSAKIVFLALVFLFAGALWSVRHMTGAYLLIPIYATLRFCLFFLGSAPPLLLTVIALIALGTALHYARKTTESAYAHSMVFLLFAAVPLTMLAVNLQAVTAVQCFLFGGLALGASGMLGSVLLPWPKKAEQGVLLSRFLFTPVPGTFPGMGALLVIAGLVLLGETVGSIERIFLVIFGIFFVITLLFLSRISWKRTGVAGWSVAGIAQAILLLGGAVFFAHLLSYLGTSIGGTVPDARIEIDFANISLTLVPWMLLGISGVLGVGYAMLLRRAGIQPGTQRFLPNFLTMLDERLTFQKYTSWFTIRMQHIMKTIDRTLTKAEQRAARFQAHEAGALMLVYFFIMVMILF